MAEAESSMALRISATGPQAPPAAFVLEQGEVLLLGIMGWGGADGWTDDWDLLLFPFCSLVP